MTCPICESEGRTSQIYPDGYGTSTLMNCPPYYDEQGKLHYHDRNTISSGGRCSNGHTYSQTAGNKCWCGWGKDESILWEERA